MGVGVAAALAIIAALVVSSYRKPTTESEFVLAYALPGLLEHVNDVKGISLKIAENKNAVTLSKGEKGWAVIEKNGYPADVGKLRGLLLQLAETKLLQEKTSNPQRYPDLGVDDITSKDAKGIMVSLDGLGKPTQLLIGNQSSQGNGTFVRRPEDKQSWLAQANISLERDAAAWLDKTLVDINAERIAEISVAKPGNKSLRLYKEKPDLADFQLVDKPIGRELESASVNQLASVLSSLTLSDVVPRQAAQAPGEDQLLKAQYKTLDGIMVDIKSWSQNDKYWLQLAATLDPAKVDSYIAAEQTKVKAGFEAQNKTAEQDKTKAIAGNDNKPPVPLAIADPAKDRQLRLEKLNEEINNLNQRFTGWSFEIQSYVYNNLNKAGANLLKAASTETSGGAKPAKKKAADKK